jgi:hypothetical protein
MRPRPTRRGALDPSVAAAQRASNCAVAGSETALALAVAGGDEPTTAALMLAEVVKSAGDLSCALTRVSLAWPCPCGWLI